MKDKVFITFTFKGKTFGKGLNIDEGFPKTFYKLLMSMFRTLPGYSADTKNRMDGSIDWISFKNDEE